VTSVSTHVLDTAGGGGRVGVVVTLTDRAGTVVASARTDGDGRVAPLAEGLTPGPYRLAWAGMDGAFVREVAVVVDLADDRHYHVPLLSSPVSAVVYLGV
jgi:5-hydroxyisourate hydrolase